MDTMFGKEGRDKVTGFKGIIVGKLQYMFGCTQYGLAPKVTKEGKCEETTWFDEGRIEVVGKGVQPEKVQAEKPGCGSFPKSAGVRR